MSSGASQALLIASGGLLYALVVVLLSRRRLISLRYTIGWLGIAGLGILGALLTPLIQPFAETFGMSPTGVLLAVATVLLLTITLQLSISVSGLQAALRDVAEAHALLRRDVDEQLDNLAS